MLGRDILIGQLDLIWRLAHEALADLTPDEALWVPTESAWTVHRSDDGRWVPDWEDSEPEIVPSTSIAWVQWHVMWWWSTVIDQSFGNGLLVRSDVSWHSSEEAMGTIGRLHDEWLLHLNGLTAEDLRGDRLTRWPYNDGRPFGHVVGWVNLELMKNVAEMAFIRHTTPFYGKV